MKNLLTNLSTKQGLRLSALPKMGQPPGVAANAKAKRARPKKLLGISIGEHSLMVAEVAAGDRPVVTRLFEMPYSAGVTVQTPEKMGAELAQFLQNQLIAARAVVFGLPARWIVARPKDVPDVDESTLSDILRLQAEAEFSTELKDLVYDYAAARTSGIANIPANNQGNGQSDSAVAPSVLLVATPQRYLQLCQTISTIAKLRVLAVMPAAMALGEMTAQHASPGAVVLSMSSGSMEMTAQRLTVPTALRHLRASGNTNAFVSELRRVVSTLPADTRKEMLLWDDSGVNPNSVSEQLGLPVRSADLSILGVDTESAASNGQGRKFAAAVALALVGLSANDPIVDFAHSRLAPPKERLIPQWAVATGLGVLLLIALIYFAIDSLHTAQANVNQMQQKYDSEKGQIADATAFVDKVSFAQAWHGGDPRYLAAIRDITMAISDDADTYATNLTLHEIAHTASGAAGSSGSSSANGTSGSAAAKADAQVLQGTLQGKTNDQERVQALIERMRRNKSIVDPRTVTSDVGRAKEVTFAITFNYISQPAATPTATSRSGGGSH